MKARNHRQRKNRKISMIISICAVVVLLGTLFPVSVLATGDTGLPASSEGENGGSQSLAEEAPPQALPPAGSEETQPAPAAQQHTLTINYLSGAGAPLARQYTAQLEDGQAYSVSSPPVEGYAALQDVVQGQIDGSDVQIDVTYRAVAPAAGAMTAQSAAHKLAVNYFYMNDGSEVGGSVAAEPFYGEFLEGEAYSIPSPPVAGYLPDIAVVAGSMGSADITVDVRYFAAGQTPYTVQHLFEDLQGAYAGDNSYPTQTLYGQTGSNTGAQAHYVPGFVTDAVTQTPIAADGSTEVVIHYARVTNYVYFNNGGKAYMDPLELRYGASAPVPPAPAATGYSFAGWYLDSGFTQPFTDTTITMGETDINLYAKWDEQQAFYARAWWIEDPNNPGTYEFYSIKRNWRLGTVGTLTNVTEADLPAYTAYSYAKIENVVIQPDGSSIVNLYLDRNTFTLYFYRGPDWDGSDVEAWENSIETTPFKTITAKYGSNISQQWNALGDEFFSYSWVMDKSPFARWLIAYRTMSSADMYYYGVPRGKGQEYFTHYYFEILDQASDSFNVEVGGVKYKDVPSLTEHFSYGTPTAVIKDRSDSEFVGFYLPTTDYCIQFDKDPLRTEHHGGYLYRRSVATVTFDTGGGSSAPPSISALFEADISALAPADPTKTGYHFGGWFTNETHTGSPFVFTTMPGTNTILYAKWIKNTYPVSFDLNYAGAQGAPDTQVIGYSDTAARPADPQRQGYAFLGWYTNAQGTGSRYVFDKPVTAATQLYAVWTNSETGYTVKYTRGDTGQPFAPDKRAVNSAGKTITEWAFVDDAQKYVPDAASKSLYLGAQPEKNVVAFIYRPFTTLSYRVEYRYAADGALIPPGVLGQASVKVVADSELARVVENYVPIMGYTPDAYQKTQTLFYEVKPEDIQSNVLTFYYSANGGAQYQTEHYLENPNAQSAADKYAAQPALTQSFSAPLGSEVTGVPQPFRDYRYNPTQSSATSSGTVLSDTGLVLKLYYDLNRYTVRFNSQGGSVVEPLTKVAGGSTIASRRPADPTRGGDVFLGWYREAECTSAWNFASDTVHGDITLYAKWASSAAPAVPGAQEQVLAGPAAPAGGAPGGTMEITGTGGGRPRDEAAAGGSRKGGLPGGQQGGSPRPGIAGAPVGAWSLLNLLLTIIGLLAATLTLLFMVARRSRKRDDEAGQTEGKAEAEDERRSKRTSPALQIIGCLAGILLLILFLVLEDITLPMVWIDRWTPLMLFVFVAELLALILGAQRIFGKRKDGRTLYPPQK